MTPKEKFMALISAQTMTELSIKSGENVSHNFVLKPDPTKPWRKDGFSYCNDCGGFSWGLSVACPTKIDKLLKKNLKLTSGVFKKGSIDE